jgi:hypothetical protein
MTTKVLILGANGQLARHTTASAVRTLNSPCTAPRGPAAEAQACSIVDAMHGAGLRRLRDSAAVIEASDLPSERLTLAGDAALHLFVLREPTRRRIV